MQKMTQQEERHARALAAAATAGVKKRSNRSNNASVALQQDELERVEALKESYQRLKDVTVGQNVADVIRRYQERVDSHEGLQRTAEALKETIQEQQAQKSELQGAWENASRRTGGAMVSAHTTRAARDAVRAGAASEEAEEAEGSSGAAWTKDFQLLAGRPRERAAVIAEFETHLQEREAELHEAQHKHDTLTQLLTDVELGVQHLAEKLAVGHGKEDDGGAAAAQKQPSAMDGGGVSSIVRNATATSDLLRSCDTKLQMMMEVLSETDIAEATRVMTTSKVIIPESNIRVPELVASRRDADDDEDAEDARGGKAQAGAKSTRLGGTLLPPVAQVDEFPDSDIHNRHELKMMSRAAVEREEKKARKQQQQRRKEETV
ncbi:hypothetical protein STCU_05846 [Strigomonas culicis]|uniref:Uncharacterized protein n=1 Tax=Strigomonas culicis TaxID=28005 RepID=S9UE88_9TRYP|nr:hypothetical protein STCU_05846 [Strigomonas culicis]|eukprot:EPY27248.1 hypothetical protein STCU_05846 [Strigomonas culicis]